MEQKKMLWTCLFLFFLTKSNYIYPNNRNSYHIEHFSATDSEVENAIQPGTIPDTTEVNKYIKSHFYTSNILEIRNQYVVEKTIY